MRRRDMLLGAACAWGPAPEPTRDLLALFDDPEAAWALGRHALAAMPGLRPEALAAALWRELDGPGPLRRRVAAAARRDFAAGRVACVDGWMLAAVEARLCALAVLSSETAGR